MKCNKFLVGMAAALVMGEATGQDATFTSQFPIDDCHFSTFGGQPHFILNPGHQLVLKGEEDGEQMVLTVTALDKTKEITLPSGNKTRKILTRVVEERATINGELTELARYWYARCLETGDVYYFGEEVDFYEDGMVIGHFGAWEAGVNDATLGMIMPRTFMLGARYFQEMAPGYALDKAENIAMGLTIVTPAGTFENCVQIKEYDGLRPELDPAIKTYAPGIGLISDEDILKLAEFRLGTVGLPSGCTLVPFSNHPFFPFSPGRQLVLEGVEAGEKIVQTITALDAIREIPLMVGAEEKIIKTRVIEERETVDGELSEVSRSFFAQCVETGDVYYFGEDVDDYAGGQIIGHNGTWLAGVSNAQPGIIMPGNFTVGARYFQEMAPRVATDLGVNSAAGVTSSVPAGIFTGCVRVTETNTLDPLQAPSVKTYAPGIGLISDGDVLKLTAFTNPNAAPGSPILSIQDSVLLTWPLTEQAFRVESSSDMRNWVPLPQSPWPVDGRNQTSAPRDAAQKYFRLTTP